MVDLRQQQMALQLQQQQQQIQRALQQQQQQIQMVEQQAAAQHSCRSAALDLGITALEGGGKNGTQPKSSSKAAGGLSMQMLAAECQTVQDRKNMIGERLYPLIANIADSDPGKITGMLLEAMEPSELLNLLEDQSFPILMELVSEATKVLNVKWSYPKKNKKRVPIKSNYY